MFKCFLSFLTNNDERKHAAAPVTFHRRISKARNSFFVFLHEFRGNLTPRVVKALTCPQIAQMAAKRWNQLSDDHKQSYKVIANKNRERMKPKIEAQQSYRRCVRKINQSTQTLGSRPIHIKAKINVSNVSVALKVKE
uniref:HMG box domain-containing protein n=1 Tax=Glossina brevipalpis TaxID=37001 RepID=A0A1A9WJZ2_9MUSC